jgi:hypothetical protein
MNPEVLVIHKPLSHFNDLTSGRLLSLMREFVDHRGIEQPVNERASRRFRTCIFSAATTKGLDLVDMVLHVSNKQVHRAGGKDLDELQHKLRELHRQFRQHVDGNNTSKLDDVVTSLLLAPWIAPALGLTSEDMTSRQAFAEEAIRQRVAEVDRDKTGMIHLNELDLFINGIIDTALPQILKAVKECKRDGISPPGESPDTAVSAPGGGEESAAVEQPIAMFSPRRLDAVWNDFGLSSDSTSAADPAGLEGTFAPALRSTVLGLRQNRGLSRAWSKHQTQQAREQAPGSTQTIQAEQEQP